MLQDALPSVCGPKNFSRVCSEGGFVSSETATMASSLVSATIADAERESIAQGRRIDL